MGYDGLRHTRVRDLFSLRIDPLTPVPITEPVRKLAFLPVIGNDSINREATPNDFQAGPVILS